LLLLLLLLIMMTTTMLCLFAAMQHMAAVRQVFNPIEKDDVIGITNYIDVGLQLHVPLTAEGTGPGDKASAAAAAGDSSSSSDVTGTAGLRLAGAWQVKRLILSHYCCSKRRHIPDTCVHEHGPAAAFTTDCKPD
jgi:hypothetical protein